MAERIGDYDQSVREVQKSIAELPPEAFNAPDRVAGAILAVVDAEHPPLRLATGTTAVEQIGAALQAHLDELQAWRAISEAADGAPAAA